MVSFVADWNAAQIAVILSRVSRKPKYRGGGYAPSCPMPQSPIFNAHKSEYNCCYWMFNSKMHSGMEQSIYLSKRLSTWHNVNPFLSLETTYISAGRYRDLADISVSPLTNFWDFWCYFQAVFSLPPCTWQASRGFWFIMSVFTPHCAYLCQERSMSCETSILKLVLQLGNKFQSSRVSLNIEKRKKQEIDH